MKCRDFGGGMQDHDSLNFGAIKFIKAWTNFQYSVEYQNILGCKRNKEKDEFNLRKSQNKSETLAFKCAARTHLDKFIETRVSWDCGLLILTDRGTALHKYFYAHTAKFPLPVDIKHVRQRWTNKDGSVLFWFLFLGSENSETFKQRGLRGARGLYPAEWCLTLSIGYLYSKISSCCSHCWLQNRGGGVSTNWRQSLIKCCWVNILRRAPGYHRCLPFHILKV